jgi:alkyldihydroxyacetonephosphate synthase
MKEGDVEAYRKFQSGLLQKIQESGGSLSHHHGVGRLISKLMPKHLGEQQMNVLKVLKNHFDPNEIMNPGKQLIP